MTATRFLPLDSYRFAHLAITLCAITLLAAPSAIAGEAAERDLQGILPEDIPTGLGEGAFVKLTDNWADWAKETSNLVFDFYLSENDEVYGRRATLDRLRVKVNTLTTALNDPQYLPIYGPLADLHGRLSRRVDLAEAILQTLEQDVTQTAHSRFVSSLANLADSASALRAHLNEVVGGQKWINYLRVNEIAAAGRAGDGSDTTIELLVDVANKLGARTELGEAQREFLSREPFLQFEDALGNTLAILNAQDPAGYRDYLRELSASLLKAIEDYETEPTAEHMQAVRHAFDDIRRAAPDGGAVLTEAMRRHYLNFNLRVVMDETLMQDILRDTRMESGYINEMVSGAKVTGCQWTNTTVNMDLRPSDTGVKIELNLNGTIRSSAQGESHAATVFVTGRHCFSARKTLYFDGDHFKHWCAAISAGGANCPYAAETCLSWAPILGNASEKLVLKIANEKGPETNAYTIGKIRKEVGTQFDRETSKMLQEAELGLEEKVNGPLREGGYYPDIKEFRSTETEAIVRTRLMESGEVGGSDPLPLPIYPTHGVLVQIHESLLNQVGNRLDLDGKRFTPDELSAYLKAELESITGKPVDLGDFADIEGTDPNAEKVEEIIFHDSDAVRFQINGGQVVLILSIGLKVEGKEEIPPQRISVPLTVSLAGDTIVMERGTVGVRPIGPVPPGGRGQQITRAGIMRSKIQEAFKSQEFDSVFSFDAGQKTVTLRVTDLRANGGWLSVIATDGITETGQPKAEAGRQSVRQARQQRNTITR